MKPPNAGKGRTKGVPNKVTTEFRQMVSNLLSGNLEHTQRWLTEVADGCPEKGLKPEPGKALELMAKLAEFVAPKLGRVEHTGEDGGPIDQSGTVTFVWPENGK